MDKAQFETIKYRYTPDEYGIDLDGHYRDLERDIPALIAEVERLAKRVDELEAALASEKSVSEFYVVSMKQDVKERDLANERADKWRVKYEVSIKLQVKAEERTKALESVVARMTAERNTVQFRRVEDWREGHVLIDHNEYQLIETGNGWVVYHLPLPVTKQSVRIGELYTSREEAEKAATEHWAARHEPPEESILIPGTPRPRRLTLQERTQPEAKE